MQQNNKIIDRLNSFMKLRTSVCTPNNIETVAEETKSQNKG